MLPLQPRCARQGVEPDDRDFQAAPAAKIERRPGRCGRGHAVDHADFVVHELVPMDDDALCSVPDTDQFRGE